MEVLVAMLILAIGLLGLASLQAQSLKFNHDSYVRSQATILAAAIMDKMRSNPTVSYTDGITDPVLPDDCDEVVEVNSSNPINEKCFWLTDLQTRLPSGTGTIVVNAANSNMFDVTIMWSDREIDNEDDCDEAAGGAAARIFDADTNICMVSQLWTVFP